MGFDSVGVTNFHYQLSELPSYTVELRCAVDITQPSIHFWMSALLHWLTQATQILQ